MHLVILNTRSCIIYSINLPTILTDTGRFGCNEIAKSIVNSMPNVSVTDGALKSVETNIKCYRNTPRSW